MASRRTDLIGLIVPDARQPFFAEMAHAVEQAAAERGKMVLVGNSDYLDEREVHYLRAFLGMRVSGLILVSQGPSEQRRRRDRGLGRAGRAAARAARRRSTTSRSSRTTSAARSSPPGTCWSTATRTWPASAASETTPAVGDPVTDHVEGWRRAMQEAGTAHRGPALPGPVQPLRRLPGRRSSCWPGPDRPPAIFCSTDDQAIGVLRAARELRIDVPGELAVAGFDDVKEAALTDPPLTTVASDRQAMARAAVDLVLDDGLRVAGVPAGAAEAVPVARWWCGGPAAAGSRRPVSGGRRRRLYGQRLYGLYIGHTRFCRASQERSGFSHVRWPQS